MPANTLALAAITAAQLSDTLNASAKDRADAFGRSRVSNPVTELDSKFTVDLLPELYNAPVVGTGAVAHVAGTTAATLTVAAAADEASLILRHPLQYRAFQSQQVAMTGAFGAHAAGVEQRMGYLPGIYLRQDAAGLAFCIYDSFTGLTEEALQADWNRDTAAFLDPANGFILVMDMQYLGHGLVRLGFVKADGSLCWCHEFQHVGSATTPYMHTANMRPGYSIVSTLNLAGPVTMTATCVGAMREGAAEEPGQDKTAETETLLSVGADLESLITIRVRPGYQDHATAKALAVAIANGTANSFRWLLLRQDATNGLVPGTPAGAWTPLSSGAVCEYHAEQLAVTYTPGSSDVLIAAGALTGTAQSRGQVALSLDRVLPLGQDAAGDPDVYVLCAQRLGGANASAYAALGIEELQ